MFRSLSVAFGRFWPSIRGRVVAAAPAPMQGAGSRAFRVRPAIRRDYAEICELYEELDAFHRRARPDLFDRPAAPPRTKATIFGLIEGHGSTILVAEAQESETQESETAGGRILGFVVLIICDLPPSTVCRARRFVEIDKLAVRPEARRRGIGRALVGEAVAWAEGRGLGNIEVAVNDFNTGAIALYESFGFEPLIRRLMRRARA